MPLSDDELRLELAWKVEAMDADIKLKKEQMRWEPWKAMSAAFTAGVLVAGAFVSAGVWLGAHFSH
jgi:hypothetical protein